MLKKVTHKTTTAFFYFGIFNSCDWFYVTKNAVFLIITIGDINYEALPPQPHTGIVISKFQNIVPKALL